VSVAYGRDAADVALVTQFGPLEMLTMEVHVQPSFAEGGGAPDA